MALTDSSNSFLATARHALQLDIDSVETRIVQGMTSRCLINGIRRAEFCGQLMPLKCNSLRDTGRVENGGQLP